MNHHDERIARTRRAERLALTGLAASAGIIAFVLWAHFHPAEVKRLEIKPTAVIRNVVAGSRAEQRLVERTWPGLEQRQIDDITAALKAADTKQIVTIFCENEAYCGDLRDDFENALESAHWSVATEKPLIDTTAGMSTSSELLKSAIEAATGQGVNLIPKQAPYYALVIGRHVGGPVVSHCGSALNETCPHISSPIVTVPSPEPARVEPSPEPTPVEVAPDPAPAEPIVVPSVEQPQPSVRRHHRHAHVQRPACAAWPFLQGPVTAAGIDAPCAH